MGNKNSYSYQDLLKSVALHTFRECLWRWGRIALGCHQWLLRVVGPLLVRGSARDVPWNAAGRSRVRLMRRAGLAGPASERLATGKALQQLEKLLFEMAPRGQSVQGPWTSRWEGHRW